jgi:hypothetical protein
MIKCVFCSIDCGEFGNNPAPLTNKHRCCDDCNRGCVIPYRLWCMGMEHRGKPVSQKENKRNFTKIIKRINVLK